MPLFDDPRPSFHRLTHRWLCYTQSPCHLRPTHPQFSHRPITHHTPGGHPLRGLPPCLDLLRSHLKHLRHPSNDSLQIQSSRPQSVSTLHHLFRRLKHLPHKFAFPQYPLISFESTSPPPQSLNSFPPPKTPNEPSSHQIRPSPLTYPLLHIDPVLSPCHSLPAST